MPRITGKLGALYYGYPTLVKIADIFDWSLELTTAVENGSVKMDAWDRFVPGEGNGRITARRYVQTFALLATEVLDSAVGAFQVTFRLDLVDANVSFSQISGTGYVTRGALNAPRELSVDEFEITIDGTPTFT